MKSRIASNPPARKVASKNPKWIEPLEARIAPAVTIINVDSLAIDLDGDGKADPLDTIHYNVTVQNTGPGDITGMSFQDIISDPNLTLVNGSVNVSPLAIDDLFTAVGNTLLRVGGSAGASPEVFVTSGSLTANDFEFLADTFTLTPIVNGASTQGGTVNVAADGTFTYIPAVDFTGTDSFTYTLRDDGIDGIAGNADDLTNTGTVTITVANKVWYIDSAAAAGGDGRSTSPFNSLASLSGATGLDDPGDTIYVRERAGDYDGNLTLLANQKLIGSGVNLVIGSFTLATATSATTLKTTAANTNAITLASGNTIRGFSILDTTGAGILGANIGTLTIDNVSKTGTGKIIDLTGTTGNSANVTLDVATTTGSSSEAIRLANVNGTFTATTGAISGVSGTDVLISGGTVAVSIGSSITGNAGGSIEVASHATGNITFSGALNITGGTGIHVHDNASGTIAFTNASKVLNTGAGAAVSLQTNGTATIEFTNGGLNIDTTTGAGFIATGGGTVTVTGPNNSINSVSAVALNVSNTNIGAAGLNFHDISAGNNTAAVDAANGIVLNNTGTTVGTHGSLIISGDGVTTVGGNSSGGTIQSVFGAGISLTSTLSPSFTNLTILNTGGSGISGTTTTNFTLKNSTISFSGNSLGAETSNIAFNTTAAGTERNLSGTVTITGNALTSAYYHGVDIFNFNGTISNADISGNTITSSTSTANSKGHGIRLIAFGSASTVANVTKASLSNNIITGFPSGAGIMAQGGNANSVGGPGLPGTFGVANSATGDVISITGNRIAGYSLANRMGTQGILAVVNGYGQGNFDISNNGTTTNPITNITGTAIAVSSLGFANVTANVSNNVIVANNTAGAQGIGAGTSRTFSATDTPNLAVKINNNRISQTDGNGILVTARDATGTVAAEINFNNVSAPLTGFRNGIRVDAGNSLSANDRVFLEISNNTTTGNASSPEGVGLRKEGLSSTVNVFAIRGLTATASPNVENYVNSQNPGSANGTLLISADSGFTNWTGGAGQPPLIPLIFAPEAPGETGDNEPDGGTSVGGNENPTETPVVTPPSGETTPVVVDDGVLSQPELDALVAAAIARWEAAGLTAEQSALLHSVTFTVADLPGWYLGSASDGSVTLDIDGAGNGWFVDSSPLDDSEFANIGGSLTATINGGARGHLDALTTIMHEFGHVLGLDDSYAAADSKDLMYGSLHLNERRLPTANQADGAIPHAHAGADFLFGPLNLGTATLPAGKSITIVYDQTVNSTINATTASSQISFTSSAGTVLSDDPSIAGTNNPTVTQLDKPDVTVAVGVSSVVENSGNTFTYTFTRQGPTTDAWTANFSVAGTALSNDYSIGTQAGVTFDSGTGIGAVTFAAGQSTATVVVTITGENVVEADETVIVSLTSGANYDVGTPASATGTVINDDAATVTISGGTVAEGDSGTANLPFTITLSNPVDVATTVQFSTANGTAIAGSDYTAQSAITVTIPAGQTSVTQNVLVSSDNTVELDETFTGSIGTLSAGGRNVTLGTASVTGTITNDDAATASISVGSIAEGNSGTVNLPFTVTLTKPVDVATTFQFSTADITAIAGNDYVAQSGVTITIPAGQLSATQNVVVNGDNTVELNETFSGSIASPSASGRAVALGTTTSATATITNDDTATISVSAGTITEGNSGTANLPFTVTLTKAVDVDTVVQFSTADITALAGSDYVAQSGVTLTIPAGQLSVTQNVVVNGDNTVELTETFSGSISGLSVGGRGVTLATATAAGTITNDDSATVSLMGGTIVEGNSGTTSLPFTVILSNPVDIDTVVEFTTEDGTAQAGSDYVGQSLVSITIPAGQTSVTHNVVVNGDNVVELNETFTATVGVVNNGGRNVNGGSTVATSQIANDDAATISITGGTITEGNSGTANLPFTITLSNPVDVATTVEFSITGGTASGVTDYINQAPITITIPAGQTSVTHNVVVNGDNLVELDETITASIGSLGNNGRAASLGTTSATGTITNDDTSVITITGFNVSEGNSGTASLPFVITLSQPVDVDTTVQFSTADLTAVAPGDYTAESLVTVMIPAGQTIVTHHVSVNGDSVVEGDEAVTGSLSGLASSGRSVTLGTASSTATILNDDAEITLAVSPGSVLEDGTQTLVYTFTRTGFTAAPLTVNFNVDGTATLNTDYTASSAAGFSFGSTAGSITFAANSPTATIIVDPTADTSGETDETVSLTLATGAGYTIGTANNATGTILDDDTKVSIAVAPGSIGENSGSNLLYTFTRTGDTSLPLTVNFTYGGNAAFGSDYNQTGAATFAGGVGTVIIPAGNSSVQVSLGMLNDQLVEGSETAILSVAPGSGYGIDTVSSATGTITDNDTAVIRFRDASSSVGEAGGTHNVAIELIVTADGVVGAGTLAQPASVNVSRLGTSTADPEGGDYTYISPITFTFGSGASSGTQNATITINNDARVEGDETIDFSLGTLSDPTEGQVSLGSTTAHTVTIDDNDTATISLANATSNVGEGAGTHNVGVTLVINADGTGPATLERNITVNLQDLLTGTATSNEGGDYGLATTTTLTFASGEGASTKNATIGITNDIRVEGNETINLQLNGLNDGTSGQVSLTGSPAHTVTISDNDFATISLANGSTTVGEGGGTHNIGVVLTITANGVAGNGTLDRDVTVNLADLLTGTATAGGSDYNLAALSTLTFAAGESGSTKNVSIGLVNDPRVEGSETINLQLNGLNDGTGSQVSLTGSPAHTVTITDNDFATISLAPQNGIISESAGTHNIGVVLTITANGEGTGTLDRAVSVNLSDLLVGNATNGSDYTFASPQTVSFGVGANSSTQNVAIGITDDTRVEGNEVLSLQLGSLTDGSSGQVTLGESTSQTLAIVDNDTATISFTQGTSTAGEGVGNHNVGVTLVITANGVVGSGTLERDVTVSLTDLLNGSASAAGDYTLGTPQTITFTSGAAGGTQNVAIGVINDARVEGDETINLSLGTLSDPTEGQVSLGSTTAHTVTIDDNDTATISLANAASNVGEAAGTHNVGVTLVINADGTGPATLERSISVNLQDLLTGTATSNEGGDYGVPTTTTLTFESGESASTKNVTIGIVNDTRVEGNETINLQLNGLNDGTSGQVSLTGSPAHTVTINDNDFATISLVNGATTVGEDNESHNISVVLTITANGVAGSGTLDRNVTVNLADLLTGTATAGGSDYNLAASSTLTFAAGESGSTKSVNIGLVNDDRVEGDETIKLELSGLNDGTAGQVSLVEGSTAHTVTITDNDFATISLAPQNGLVNEDAGSQNIGVVLTITANGTLGAGTLERPVSVNLVDLLVPGATNGSDYTFNSPQTVTFAVGASSSTQNVAIGITDDTRVEGNESLGLDLKGLNDGTNGQVSLGNATTQLLSIVDNDTATISFGSATSTIGEAGGNHNVGVTLVITANGVVGSGTLERPISVTLSDLLTGTAVAPGDYTLGTPQTITFASGDASSTKNVVVGVIDDNASEGNETINLQLGSLNDPTEGQVSLVQPTGHTVTITDNDIDLVVTKTGPTTPVIAGSGAGNLTYVITVTNAGLTNATGVVLSEDLTLVPGVSIVSITPSANGGTFDLNATPDGIWTLGNLGAGESATLTVVLTVDSSTAAGTNIISDTATVTSSNEVRINVGDDFASASTSVDRLVDLSLTKTDGLATTTPGSLLTYTLNVTNSQPSDAKGVVLTETVPLGTTFNAGASSAGWVETSPGVYTLNLGTVAGNSSAAPVTFAVTVNSSVPAGLHTIANTASLADDGSLGGDSTPLNNTAIDTNTLEATPDLVVAKTVSPATLVRGGLVTYSITYSNVGNQAASGVRITEHLPSFTTFQAAGSTAGWTSSESGTYDFFIAEVAAGASATITFQVKVDSVLPGGTTTITNTVDIGDDAANGIDLTPANNTSTVESLLYQGIYVVSPGVALPRKGAPADVRVFDIATGEQLFQIPAYESTYRDSVRIAVGDINGDGYDDIITSTRTGTGRVRVFDGVTGEQFEGAFAQIDPFDGKKRKGAFVASGDVNGDGHDDIVVGSAAGGGEVKVYSGIDGSQITSYTPFGKKFRGGVKVAVGDVNGDGIADIIAAQGLKGSAVKVFSGTTQDVLQEFKVGPGKYRGGVNVAAADLDGDNKSEIIVGRNTGKPTQIEVISGVTGQPIGSEILPFGSPYRFGVRVAAADVNLDGVADIIAAVGGRGGSQVKVFDGATKTELTEFAFAAFPTYPNSALFVAGSSPVPSVPQIVIPNA